MFPKIQIFTQYFAKEYASLHVVHHATNPVNSSDQSALEPQCIPSGKAQHIGSHSWSFVRVLYKSWNSIPLWQSLLYAQ
jgi:hypothetical protein